MRKRLFQYLVPVLMLLASAGPLMAGEPTEQVKETSDKIIAILEDKQLSIEEVKRRIRKVVDERFDWRELARRSLARYWKDRTEEEIHEFIEVYSQLLERTYLDRVEEYSGERVIYVGESVEGNYAIVNVKIISQQRREIPVQYRLKREGDQWMVYDIVVEGVSLVQNYRSQFNSILARSSFDELMEKLRQKVQEEKKG